MPDDLRFTPAHRETLKKLAADLLAGYALKGILYSEGYALRAVLAEVQRLEAIEQRVNQWRCWAQFVFCNGGKPPGSDDDMQRTVCAAVDSAVEQAEAERDKARAALGQIEDWARSGLLDSQCEYALPREDGVQGCDQCVALGGCPFMKVLDTIAARLREGKS